jgi:hypothetical protein
VSKEQSPVKQWLAALTDGRNPEATARFQPSGVHFAMTNTSRLYLVALGALAAVTATAALGAQQSPAVQLAFGYECGDRFLIKNEGAQPVALEWKTTGSQDRSQLHLNPSESREIASASSDAVELWVNGKVVATEPKGNKPCSASGTPGAPGAPGTPSVVVRPLNTDESTGAGDPPSRVARVSSIQGNVSFQAGGSAAWGVATLNSSVTTGDRLVADDGSRGELEIGSAAIRFGSSTDVAVTSLTDGLLQLGAPAGTVRLSVYRMNAGDTIEVDTPNGAVGVLTPGSYRIMTNAAGTQTIVSVERGRIDVTGPSLSQVVEAGRTIRLSEGDGGTVQLTNVPRPGPDGFDSWSQYRDGVLTGANSASDAYVNPDIPGVRDLDDAGSWDNDAADGPVWYPTGVEAGWVPYRDGHWGWVEPWGWTWIADEPWGFAPFHYGRWAYVRNRWGWFPGPRLGRPYYSPALVAFADGGGFGLNVGVSAWFPLGPRDPFIPWYHHDDRYLRAVNGANVRGVGDINAFVHVRDVEHFHYANRSAAMTVVPTASFAAGRPVARDAMHVSPERIATARIAPHPAGVPTREAVVGMTAPRPHAAIERGDVVARAPVPFGMARGEEPGGNRVQPPTRTSVQQVTRPLVVRAPIPPAAVPFEARQKAIAAHPGRPLEPQQMQNLRAGRPAGPQRDPEPPHAQPRPPERQPERNAQPKKPN